MDYFWLKERHKQNVLRIGQKPIYRLAYLDIQQPPTVCQIEPEDKTVDLMHKYNTMRIVRLTADLMHKYNSL